MAYSDSFPAVRPVFQSDFANGGRIDPRISYSRSTTGTYFGTEKVLSSENLLTYSNPNNAAWNESNGATVSTNASAAPDGTTTASSIIEDSANSQHRTFASINATSGQVYTLVTYLKGNGRTIAQVATSGASAAANVEFDLSGSGTATTRSGSPANSSISQIGSSGWYKCSFQVTAGSTATLYLNLYLCDSANSNTYTGDGSSGVYAYGFNLSSIGQLVHEDTSGQIAREYQTKLQTAAINAPRFEYSPTDSASAALGESLGLLVEGSSTNLLNYSEQFDNGYWTKSNTTVTTNAAVAPSGELTADLITADQTGGSTSHNCSRPFAFTSGNTYTLSVFAKAAGYNKLWLYRGNPATWEGVATFELTGSGTVSNVTGSASIESVGNGWYRCSVTGTAGATATTSLLFGLDNGDGTLTYDGDDFSGVLLWGAMMEQASHSSSYLKVEGSTVTRAADSASMVDSSLFDNGSGAVFVESSSIDKSAAYSGIASLNDGSSNNRVEVYNYYTYVRGDVGADGATQSSQYGGTFSNNVPYKACITYDSNNVSLYANGAEIGTTDTSATMPTVDRITLGNTNSGTNYLNGHLKRVAVYSDSISETAAAAITS